MKLFITPILILVGAHEITSPSMGAELRGQKKISILMPLDRSKIKDASGESLSDKMKRASQSYLELRLDEAVQIADESLDLLAQQWPYASMQADVREIYSLKILAMDAVPIPESLRSFSDQTSFVTSLPIKFQAALSSLNSKATEIKRNLVDESAERIFVFANEVQWPLTLKPGRWLVHGFQHNELKAFWIDVSSDPNTSPKMTKLWTRTFLKPLFSSGTAVESSNLKSKQWPNDFSTEIQENSESPSIFKSPWFWIIAGSALGVGGYFALQSAGHSGATTR